VRNLIQTGLEPQLQGIELPGLASRRSTPVTQAGPAGITALRSGDLSIFVDQVLLEAGQTLRGILVWPHIPFSRIRESHRRYTSPAVLPRIVINSKQAAKLSDPLYVPNFGDDAAQHECSRRQVDLSDHVHPALQRFAIRPPVFA
jgi:hypothetical protein